MSADIQEAGNIFGCQAMIHVIDSGIYFFQFQALEEADSNVLDLETFKLIFKEKIKATKFPQAAASFTKTAIGKNFTLYLEFISIDQKKCYI